MQARELIDKVLIVYPGPSFNPTPDTRLQLWHGLLARVPAALDRGRVCGSES